MKIITISAKAKCGKDYTAGILKKRLEERGAKVLVAHYADLLKYIMTAFFNWNGKKDEIGRTKLQYVGTDVIRKKQPDYWVNFLCGIFEMFPEEWDYILIPDTRFRNENEVLKEKGFDVTTVRVRRPNFDNGLTSEQKKHESEVALDNYDFDYYIVNMGDDSIIKEVDNFINWIGEKS